MNEGKQYQREYREYEGDVNRQLDAEIDGAYGQNDDVLADLENEQEPEREVVAPVTDDEVEEYRRVNGGVKQEAYYAVEKRHLHDALEAAAQAGDLDDVCEVLHRVIERL